MGEGPTQAPRFRSPAPITGAGRGRGRGTARGADCDASTQRARCAGAFGGESAVPVPSPSFSSTRRPRRLVVEALRVGGGPGWFVGFGGLWGPRERRRRPGISAGGPGSAGWLSKARWAGFRSRAGPREGNRHLEGELACFARPSCLRRPLGESVCPSGMIQYNADGC